MSLALARTNDAYPKQVFSKMKAKWTKTWWSISKNQVIVIEATRCIGFLLTYLCLDKKRGLDKQCIYIHRQNVQFHRQQLGVSLEQRSVRYRTLGSRSYILVQIRPKTGQLEVPGRLPGIYCQLTLLLSIYQSLLLTHIHPYWYPTLLDINTTTHHNYCIVHPMGTLILRGAIAYISHTHIYKRWCG